MAKRATITDIAELSGVSRTTVSLVLRDAPKIPESTKARVREAMDELGYVYNRAGAAVRAGQSSLLGLLLNDIRNPFFAEVTMAIHRATDDRELSLLQSYSFGDAAYEARTARLLAEQFLAGLVLLPTAGAHADDLRFLPAAQPLVQLLREVPGLASDFVGVDNLESGRLLGRHLAERGFPEVVLVGGSASPQLDDRHHGLQEALGADVELLLAGAETLAGRPGPLPECVVTYNDTQLLATLALLRSRGVRPGQDVAVASFDNTSIASTVSPTITSVDHHVVALAEQAVALVLARRQDRDRPLERVLVPPSLVVRESTTR